jgi:hypothetical protein
MLKDPYILRMDSTQGRSFSFDQFTPHGGVTKIVTTDSMIIQTLPTSGNPGLWPIGGKLSLMPSGKYKFVVKGHSKKEVRLYVCDSNGKAIVWPGPLLPSILDTVSVTFTVPSSVTSIQLGVIFNNANYGGEFVVYEAKLFGSSQESYTKPVLALSLLCFLLLTYFVMRRFFKLII